MKTQIKLKQLVSDIGQARAASFIGVTQGAISQMIINNRDIKIELDGDDFIRAFEIKPVGESLKRAAQ